MLSRVLELWDKVPDAEQRIGASHLAVLEAGQPGGRLAGEYERGGRVRHGRAAEIDIGRRAGPGGPAAARPAGHLSSYLLGRPGYADDLREAARLVPGRPADARRGPGCWRHGHVLSTGSTADAPVRPAPRRPWRWPGRPVTAATEASRAGDPGLSSRTPAG